MTQENFVFRFLNKTVIRQDQDKHKTEFLVTEQNAEYLHTLIAHGFTYREKLDDPFLSDKPVIRIHRAPVEECLSCSA